jgi:hypothetical protein
VNDGAAIGFDAQFRALAQADAQQRRRLQSAFVAGIVALAVPLDAGFQLQAGCADDAAAGGKARTVRADAVVVRTGVRRRGGRSQQ